MSTATTLDEYTIGHKLGEGATAKVYSARREGSSEIYAIKIFRHDNEAFNRQDFNVLKSECLAASNLDHERIVRYIAFKEHATLTSRNGNNHDVAYIVQELVTGGELYGYIANTGSFEAPIVRFYMK